MMQPMVSFGLATLIVVLAVYTANRYRLDTRPDIRWRYRLASILNLIAFILYALAFTIWIIL